MQTNAAAQGGGVEAVAPSASGSGDIPDRAAEAAAAPSPLSDAIGQSEAGRDAAVVSFQESDTTTRVMGSRVAALSSETALFAETPGADAERTRAAESRLAEFFRGASGRLDESLTLATGEVPDRLGATAETIKAGIGTAIEQQKAAHSTNVETARAQSFADAAAARCR